jgi:PAS domain-containing protein
LILSPVHLLIFTSVLLAVGLTVVFVGKRRQEHAFGEFSDQVRRLTSASGAAARIDLEGKPESFERLAGAVNQLLESLEQRGADLQGREQLFQRLVETVHYAVLVHRQRILFANSRFLALLGLTGPDVVGRHLSDFVGPEYAELVDNNLRRRLDG